MDAFWSIPWRAIAQLVCVSVAIVLLLANLVWLIERRHNKQFQKPLAALVYFAVMMPFNAIGFWAPTVIRDLGVTNLLDIGLLTALVFVAAALGTYVVGSHSDRTMERRWHIAGSGAVTALAFAMLPVVGNNVPLGVALLALAAAASYGSFVVFWTIPQTFLSRASAAGGIAMITNLGGTGGFVSPAFVGWVKTRTGSAEYGLIGLGIVLLVGIVLLLVAFPPLRKRLDSAENSDRVPA
jgi:MFS family permease